MTKRCVLHIGMTKTGSSSIQESLYHGLEAQSFQYASFGEVNSGRAILATFVNRIHHYNEKLRLTPQQIEGLRLRFRARFENKIARCRKRCTTLILSAEDCWEMSRDELEELRNFFNQRDYEIDVVAYLRPWKSWLESSFQEQIKQGTKQFEIASETELKQIDFVRQLNALDDIFGSNRVLPVLFAPSRFRNHCVVSDFCERMQIPLAPHKIRRVNDGLSLEALQLLYAHRQYGGGYGHGLKRVIQNEILFRRLREVKGTPVRFHSSLIAPLLEKFLPQVPAIERRLGTEFREDLRRDDHGNCLRDESQLREFSIESLDWLSRATGLPRIRSCSGVPAAKAVGEQMQFLCEHPSLASQYRWHRMILSRRIAHWLYDV